MKKACRVERNVEHIRQEELIRYLDGDPTSRVQIEDHLLKCEECQERLDSLMEFGIELQSLRTGEDIRAKIESLSAQIDEDRQLIEAAIEIMRREAAHRSEHGLTK